MTISMRVDRMMLWKDLIPNPLKSALSQFFLIFCQTKPRLPNWQLWLWFGRRIRTTDFRLGLLVLVRNKMTSLRQLMNRLVDLELNLIWAGKG